MCQEFGGDSSLVIPKDEFGSWPSWELAGFHYFHISYELVIDIMWLNGLN